MKIWNVLDYDPTDTSHIFVGGRKWVSTNTKMETSKNIITTRTLQ